MRHGRRHEARVSCFVFKVISTRYGSCPGFLGTTRETRHDYTARLQPCRLRLNSSWSAFSNLRAPRGAWSVRGDRTKGRGAAYTPPQGPPVLTIALPAGLCSLPTTTHSKGRRQPACLCSQCGLFVPSSGVATLTVISTVYATIWQRTADTNRVV
jgi:hypothetical protein